MPEGDTLHLLAKKLAPVVGSEVLGVSLPRSDQPTRGLVGRKLDAIYARGKNLVLSLEGPVILVHLRMTGSVRLAPSPFRGPVGQLSLAVEVPGRVVVALRAPTVKVFSARGLAEQLGRLGPDPITDDFDADEAVRRLRARTDTPLALALTDQAAIAGIGNEWKSELLFDQHLDPFAPVAAFTDAELEALVRRAAELMRVIVAAGRFERVVRPTGPPLAVYDRAGRPCLDCGGRVLMERQGRFGENARSTYYCHHCQPRRA